MHRGTPIALAAASAVLAALCGCDGGEAGPGDTTPPTIVATAPTDGATDVGLIQRVGITFSEPMDPATVNESTIAVEGRTSRSYVDYDSATRTAHVLPETLYAPLAEYAVTLSEGVTDDAGNPLVAPDTIGFRTGPLDCGHLEDYLEPNDGILQASPVELDEVYRMLALCGNDQDVFAFTLPEAARLAVHWSYRRADTLATYFDITRTDGYSYGTFTHTAESGSPRTFSFTLASGTYYLGMWASDIASYILYDVELAAEEPCPDDPYEDNDFRSEASSIEPGLLEGLRGCTYDNDFFALDLPSGVQVTITVTNTSPGEPSRLVALFPDEGPSIASAIGTENPLVVEGATIEAGTHYVQVTFYAEDVVYDLDVEVSR
jgi:hypothetical protein